MPALSDPVAAKSALLAQIQGYLEAELAALVLAASAAHAAATHEENKPENKYDTRGLEASYLASAQKERAAELQSALQTIKGTVIRTFAAGAAIAPTALVELDHDGTRSLCLVMLLGAGYPLTLAGRSVLSITTKSPLGQALLGKVEGDLATVPTAQGAKDYEIIGVY